MPQLQSVLLASKSALCPRSLRDKHFDPIMSVLAIYHKYIGGVSSFKILFLFYMHGCFASPQRPEDGTGFIRAEDIDRGELPWESNLGPLEKQPLSLTAEPSL